MNKEATKQAILMGEEINVNIVDEVMGGGKTTTAINFINKSPEDTRFLYITPYLTEVDRIITQCPKKRFKQPGKRGSKLESIKELFERKENIVSTHALFRYFNEEIIDIAYTNNYVLIMDEVADVIEPYPITKYDLNDIMANYAHVDPDTKLLVWDHREYRGEFEEIRNLCDLKSITVYNDAAMLWLFPITTFRAFKNTYILTYMFHAQAQCYYYDYYNIHYNRLYVKYENGEYQFTAEPTATKSKYDYRKLINICENEKMNDIGEKPNALSKTWYERNKNNTLMKQLQKNTLNYFRNILQSNSDSNIWTTFKDYQKLVSGQGYAKGFVPSNMRATNEYMDRDNVAYLVNKYFNPIIKQFFVSHGIDVNEDDYAVSEMLQFIWRSAIRRGRPINLYIPSKRMRTLLKDWIQNQTYDEVTEQAVPEEEVLLFKGDFYFGLHSVVVTNGKISQVKCIKKSTGDNMEIVTLQYNADDYTDYFTGKKYIAHSGIEYEKISSSLYRIKSMSLPEEVALDRYNGKFFSDVHKKLSRMKKQTKIKRK